MIPVLAPDQGLHHAETTDGVMIVLGRVRPAGARNDPQGIMILWNVNAKGNVIGGDGTSTPQGTDPALGTDTIRVVALVTTQCDIMFNIIL